MHLAQDVYLDDSRRLCVLGIFDSIIVSAPVRPIPLGAFVLVVGFEGDPGEPLQQDVGLKLFDDDEVQLELITDVALRLTPSSRGHPPKGLVAFRLEHDQTSVPDFGDYHFRIDHGDRRLGSTRLSVDEAPPEGGLRGS